MNLYAKILLAFTIVIIIAMIGVGLAAGYLVEVEFRSYNALYSNRAQRTAQSLIAYYSENDSWDGIQEQSMDVTPGGRGFGQGQNAGSAGSGLWTYRVADANGRIVANTSGEVYGVLSRVERRKALQLEMNGTLIGFLTLGGEMQLDSSAINFLQSLQNAVWFGIGIALVTALLVAGFLARGITAPVLKLTQAVEAISGGALDSRAPVKGQDEIAQLAQSFNVMVANLQQAEHTRKAQTADIAHELRNPLAVLQGSLEALADGIFEPTPENIEPVLDQVRTLNRLVEDLRTLAMVDAGVLQLEKQTVDLAVLLQRVADAHRESFEGHSISFHTSNFTDFLPVVVDYERLTQVINNILGNALLYVPAGGHVRIEAGMEAQGVVVSVVDDGPGVKPENLKLVFERFWRGDPSRSRETGGSGLGLTIARRIIDAHNGRIWAESTPGGGLTIRFWLPSA
jgi:two-component system sensor histidine kinase BaeS